MLVRLLVGPGPTGGVGSGKGLMTDSSDFARFPVACLTGGEQFHSSGRETGICLREFWSWSSSDLLNNTMRGVLAEFLVARATGVAEDARACWKPYDLKTARGLRIEVKGLSPSLQ
jgi:hypothetical protein